MRRIRACDAHVVSSPLWPPGWPEVVDRTPLHEAATGLSGATLERVTLADGRRFVLKHLARSGDWLNRLTAGHHRARQLWEHGVLGRVSDTVDHAVLAVVPTHEGDVVVMRDVSEHLLRPGSTVSISQARLLLAGLSSLHHQWEWRDVPALCPPEARYRLFSPTWHAGDTGPAPHPGRRFIVAGWEAFSDLAPSDVCEAIFAIHAQPAILSDALHAAAPTTLVHGDAKLENLGLDGRRLVAVDWGDLTGGGPAAIDVTWFAIQDGWRFEVMPDEILAAYDDAAHRRLDPVALDLACIGALAWFGFKLAGRLRTGDDQTRARTQQLLAWWLQRVEDALARWSPVLTRR